MHGCATFTDPARQFNRRRSPKEDPIQFQELSTQYRRGDTSADMHQERSRSAFSTTLFTPFNSGSA